PRIGIDEHERGVFDARADAARPDVVVDRREADTLVELLLDLREHRGALFLVQLLPLLAVERLDVWPGAVGVGAFGGHDLRQARRGVAGHGIDAHADALELLAGPRGIERRPLHPAQARSDPDGAQVGDDRLARGEVRRPRMEIAGVEAVGIAGFGEQLLGFRRIVRMRLQRNREFERAWDDIAGGPRGAESLGHADAAAI